MTFVAHRHELDRFFYGMHPGKGAESNRKPGLLRRVFHAIAQSRQRAAEQEIARYFHRQGGSLTDNVEREMTERLMANNWIIRR
jgi:hypothetical protein